MKWQALFYLKNIKTKKKKKKKKQNVVYYNCVWHTKLKPITYSFQEFFTTLLVYNLSFSYSTVIFSLVKNEVSVAGVDSTVVVTESERSPLLRAVRHVFVG